MTGHGGMFDQERDRGRNRRWKPLDLLRSRVKRIHTLRRGATCGGEQLPRQETRDAILSKLFMKP